MTDEPFLCLVSIAKTRHDLYMIWASNIFSGEILAQVRYQSRKSLAEQRPRVKGQFVRQVKNDTKVANADDSS